MMKHFTLVIAAAFGCLAAFGTPQAADLSRQKPIQVDFRLGAKNGDLVFVPNRLSFETGKLYKLVLQNPSNQSHYFSAPRFATAVWSRKVESGQAEIKGAIREIRLDPGAHAEWFFVPVQAGTFPLECTKKMHAERGMIGEITVM